MRERELSALKGAGGFFCGRPRGGTTGWRVPGKPGGFCSLPRRAGSAASGRGPAAGRGYSFQIERIPPRPQEKFWEGFRFPSQTHLKTTKGEACGPLLWKPLGGGRGTLGRETKDERRGSGTPGRRALRGVRGVSSTTLGSGAQRSACGGGGEGGVGIGVKSIPKGGKPATIAGGALSEAESAGRGAGQMQGFARYPRSSARGNWCGDLMKAPPVFSRRGWRVFE